MTTCGHLRTSADIFKILLFSSPHDPFKKEGRLSPPCGKTSEMMINAPDAKGVYHYALGKYALLQKPKEQ
jgi:hypothetical protein